VSVLSASGQLFRTGVSGVVAQFSNIVSRILHNRRQDAMRCLLGSNVNEYWYSWRALSLATVVDGVGQNCANDVSVPVRRKPNHPGLALVVC